MDQRTAARLLQDLRSGTSSQILAAIGHPRWDSKGKNVDLAKSRLSDRRRVMAAMAKEFKRETDSDLVHHLTEQELAFFEQLWSARTERTLPTELECVSSCGQALNLSCYLLAKLHKPENIWRIWKHMQRHTELAKSAFWPCEEDCCITPLYLYCATSNATTPIATTLTYLKDNADRSVRTLRDALIAHIEADVKLGVTEHMVTEFWEKRKFGGWHQASLLLGLLPPSKSPVELSLAEGRNLLARLREPTTDRYSLLAFRARDDVTNLHRRALVLCVLAQEYQKLCADQLTSSLDPEKIAADEDLLYFIHEQEIRKATEDDDAVPNVLQLSSLLVTLFGRLFTRRDNLLKIWRAKCSGPDVYFWIDASQLYLIGKTPTTANTVEDCLQYVREVTSDKLNPASETITSLLQRNQSDQRAGWLTQAYVDRWWQRNFARDWWPRIRDDLQEHTRHYE